MTDTLTTEQYNALVYLARLHADTLKFRSRRVPPCAMMAIDTVDHILYPVSVHTPEQIETVRAEVMRVAVEGLGE